MDESAIERAKERIEQRADTAAFDAVLERTRADLEKLAAAAEAAAIALPEKIEGAVHDGLREQVLPVARNLAEIRGLMNQLLRRVETLEGAAVDDLTLLVDLISSGWQGVDARLARLENVVARIEQGIQERGGAVIYRMEERRPPDAATS